jgi:hypothetical protein
MNQQSNRTVMEARTSLAPDEVLQAAKRFFARHTGIYAAFIEQESAVHITLRGQGGEEVVIGVVPVPGGTRVTGSTYMFDQQIARLFATLPPAPQIAPDALPPGDAPATETGAVAAA